MEIQLKNKEEMKSITNVLFPNGIEATEKNKYIVMVSYALLILVSGFLFNSFNEIISGLMKIITSRSILVSDYFVIGNLGAAFFNAGSIMLISIGIAKLTKVKMNGTVIAAIITIGGFSFFGKNLYNIWPIFLGVYLYAKVQGEKYGSFILVALFGTALGPLVSQISFGFEFSITIGVLLGVSVGILVGFILPPLANHFVKFHQGFNIYNIGFTAGVAGSLFMSFLRAFELETPSTFYAAEGYNLPLGIYLSLFFVSMIIIGYLFNNRSLRGYKEITKHSGRLVCDFVGLAGFGLSFINMGLVGLLGTGYVLLVGGEINGPIIGGILTIVAFGAFGKHLKNIIPVMLGVYLSITFLFTWEINSVGALLTALFGTTLAPIAGEFGFKYGLLAGVCHTVIVMQTSVLHGGVNLYNNGFAGGLAAAILVPILIAFRQEEQVKTI
ncbi:MAG: DUF1576 domain-containing protein [Halanaerobacter sp.]